MDLETVDSLLTTTRSVRKRLDLDRPVEPEVIERCIEIAMQAPTASNLQNWHFVVVTDPARRAALAEIYRRGFADYRAMQGRRMPLWGEEDLRAAQLKRIGLSSGHLAENMHRVPVLILPCFEGEMSDAPHLTEVRDHASLYNATMYGSILAGRLVADAGPPSPRNRRGLDHPAPHVREGGGGGAGASPATSFRPPCSPWPTTPGRASVRPSAFRPET